MWDSTEKGTRPGVGVLATKKQVGFETALRTNHSIVSENLFFFFVDNFRNKSTLELELKYPSQKNKLCLNQV